MKTFKNTVAAYCGVTLVLLLGFAVLCGCTGMAEDEDNKPVQQEIGVVDKDTDVLDAETEEQIRRDYVYGHLHAVHDRTIFSLSLDVNEFYQVEVLRYLGTYHGYVAVIMNPQLTHDNTLGVRMSSYKVADMFFNGNLHTRIYVWKQGDKAERDKLYELIDAYWGTAYWDTYWAAYWHSRWGNNIPLKETRGPLYSQPRDAHDLGLVLFYELRDAYDLGLLTADDVSSMADRYYEIFEDKDGKLQARHSLTPRIPTILGFDAKTERQIRHDFLHDYLPVYTDTQYAVHDVEILHYLGTYQGYESVMMRPAIWGDDANRRYKFKVADTFFYGILHGQRIFVWKQEGHAEKGLFYELRDAYDLGLLTADDVSSMADRFHANVEPAYNFVHGSFDDRETFLDQLSLLPRYPTIFTPEELEERAQADQ